MTIPNGYIEWKRFRLCKVNEYDRYVDYFADPVDCVRAQPKPINPEQQKLSQDELTKLYQSRKVDFDSYEDCYNKWVKFKDVKTKFYEIPHILKNEG